MVAATFLHSLYLIFQQIAFKLGAMPSKNAKGNSESVRQLRYAASIERAVQRALFQDRIDPLLADLSIEIASVSSLLSRALRFFS